MAGSIFGRLLGMSRLTTVSGVFLGSVLGNGLMYAFAKTINQYINPENLWLKVAGVVILIAVVVLLEFSLPSRQEEIRERRAGRKRE